MPSQTQIRSAQMARILNLPILPGTGTAVVPMKQTNNATEKQAEAAEFCCNLGLPGI